MYTYTYKEVRPDGVVPRGGGEFPGGESELLAHIEQNAPFGATHVSIRVAGNETETEPLCPCLCPNQPCRFHRWYGYRLAEIALFLFPCEEAPEPEPPTTWRSSTEWHKPAQPPAPCSYTVAESMTTPTRPGKRPRPVWVVSGDLYGFETTLESLGGRKYNGAWSFFRDPSDALAETIRPENRQGFAERKAEEARQAEERAERLRERADAHQAEANARMDAFRRIHEHIPAGQPILVGHHSEGRHRRDIARANRHAEKAIEHARFADHLGDRADRADRRASGHGPAYIGNRIGEAKAEIRRLEKYESSGGITDIGRENLARQREALAYWQAELVKAGGTRFDRETVEIGDTVRYSRGWYPVVRINRDTVTVGNWLGVETMTWRVPYNEIQAIRKENPTPESEAPTEQPTESPAEAAPAGCLFDLGRAPKAEKPAPAPSLFGEADCELFEAPAVPTMRKGMTTGQMLAWKPRMTGKPAGKQEMFAPGLA